MKFQKERKKSRKKSFPILPFSLFLFFSSFLKFHLGLFLLPSPSPLITSKETTISNQKNRRITKAKERIMRYNEADITLFASSKDRMDHSGYLFKRGDNNPALKERWFVLKGNLLFYFKNHNVLLLSFLPSFPSSSLSFSVFGNSFSSSCLPLLLSILCSLSPFSILHSPFSVLRSPFSVLRSPFSFLHSPFSHAHLSPFSFLTCTPFFLLN